MSETKPVEAWANVDADGTTMLDNSEHEARSTAAAWPGAVRTCVRLVEYDPAKEAVYRAAVR